MRKPVSLVAGLVVGALVALAAVFGSHPAWAQAEIDSIAVTVDGSVTRLTVTGTAGRPVRVGYLTDPQRIYLDFPRTVWAAPVPKLAPGSVVVSVRRGQFDKSTLRLVLDLAAPARLRPFDDAPKPLSGHSVQVFEIEPARVTSAGARVRAVPATPAAPDNPAPAEATAGERSSVPADAAPPPAEPAPLAAADPVARRVVEDRSMAAELGAAAPDAPPVRLPPPPPRSLVEVDPPAQDRSAEVTAALPMPPTMRPPAQAARKVTPPGAIVAAVPTPMSAATPALAPAATPGKGRRVIVVDPGHGGADPGSRGARGTTEKTVTLAIAREVRRLLEESGRYQVILTRDRDEAMRLSARVARAREVGAELLLSIHADALASRDPSGASVYTLAESATDAEAEALAQRENSADPSDGPAANNDEAEVARILLDLAHRENASYAAIFAATTVRELQRDLAMVSAKPLRQAGFAVLRAPDIPSILVELGFLSNPRDEANLARPAFRATVAAALARAVEQYFARPLARS